VNRFLLIIAALLAVFLGWRWFNPVAAPDLEPVSSKGAGNGNIGELLDNMDRATRFPPLAAYHAISARPLFFNKRRPPPPYVPDKTGGKKPGPPRKTGKTRTGKPIKPMALSKTPDRYSDPEKVEKWFRRNCRSVLGRECTPVEKGDFITFMISQ